MAVPLERDEELELEQIEVELLLEGIHRRYGFDFRQYAPASLRRRVRRRMDGEKVETISALQNLLLHDPAVMERLLLDLSVNVTAMFRDPSFFLSFREKVVPMLRTYPFARLWVAGCSTGEEVYSLSILLAEEGLADRVRMDPVAFRVKNLPPAAPNAMWAEYFDRGAKASAASTISRSRADTGEEPLADGSTRVPSTAAM